MRVWTRDTFSDPLRFPSLVLVSIFNNIDLNEQELSMRLIGERKGYNWHKCESKVPAISSPILSRRLRTAARRDAGAALVAISPMTQDFIRQSVAKNNLTFDITSDSGNQMASRFGLTFQMPEDLRKLYISRFNIDLPKYNREDSWTPALAGTIHCQRRWNCPGRGSKSRLYDSTGAKRNTGSAGGTAVAVSEREGSVRSHHRR
jgi:hypothetical protein